MTSRSLGLALLTLVLNSAAQLLLRSAALRGATAERPLTLVQSPLFLAALAAYGLSVLSWLAVLKKVPLTVATPFIALVYVLVPIAARLLYGDVIGGRSAAGMLLIVIGVVLVAAK